MAQCKEQQTGTILTHSVVGLTGIFFSANLLGDHATSTMKHASSRFIVEA